MTSRRSWGLGACLPPVLALLACSRGGHEPTADAGAALSAREARRALRQSSLAAPIVRAPTTVGPKGFAAPTPIAPWAARPDHFVMRRADSTTFFTPSGFTLALRGGSADAPKGWGLHVDLVGGRPVSPRGERPGQAVVRDARAATGALPTYGQLAWEDVYPGTDMVVEPAAGGFAYRFVLSPDADPAAVALRFGGADAVRLIDAGGGVDVDTGLGSVHVRGLGAYTVEDGQRVELGARFVLREGAVGVEIRGWQRRGPLVIDPVISWARILSGSGYDLGTTMAVDAGGNVLFAGSAGSTDFPSTGGFDTTLGGSYDAFVAKISSTGTLLWSTYLGGAGWDEANRLALDASGNAYVVGYTQSADFPSTGGFDTTLGGSRDGFVAKVSNAGALLWSTYLGGASDDYASGVAVDASGNVYVTGYTQSSAFATTGAADTTLGGTQDAFLTKISSAGALSWSRFVGGGASDEGKAVAVDGAGNVYLTGKTASTDFPVASAFDATANGSDDGFVAKLDAAGTILWASYLGGAALDQPNNVAVDGSGNVVIVGSTYSSDFPTTGGFDTTSDGSEAFVTKVSGAGALLWSSYVGGTATELATGLAIDATGNVYVGGSTSAADFPSAGGFKASLTGYSDGFLAKVSPTGALAWSSYVGGSGNDSVTSIGLDGTGAVLFAGTTTSSDFPTAGGVAAGNDAYVAKLGPATLVGGAACTVDGACLSGHCADGVCCDTACTGPCVACTAGKKGSGADGTCGPIADGADPDKDCSAQSCAAGVVTKANVCNGAGACRGAGTTSCGFFACVGASCGTTCATDTDCLAGAFCSGTTCVADLPAGSACTRPTQCASGFCTENVCCDKACAGGCEACTASKKGKGTDGVCEPVAAGSDPKDACAADSGFPTSCKADGLCDGTGACRVYAPSGTACGASTCAAGVASGKTCNGAGGCDATPKSCGDYTCADDKVCRTTCAGDGDCATTAYCTTTGTCAPKGAAGATCGATKECTSGFCVDGVCCDTACDGQCQACDEAGKVGTCTTISGKPHGTKRPACADDGNGCAGSCDGKAAVACAYPDGTQVCGAGCVGSKIARCDGKGACAAPVACADSLLCADGKACKARCATNDDCIKGMTCDTATGACTPARPTCSTDLTASVSPEGASTSCVQYRCDRSVGTCHKSCSTAEQCAAGFACAGERCEPLTPDVGDDSGCATGARPLASGSGVPLGALALVALGAIAHHRRRR